MALDATKFQTDTHGSWQRHKYVTPDAIATVVASGYFNALTGQLRQWDTVEVIGSSGGTATIDEIVVTSATGAATVTTTALEGVTAS